MASFLNSSVSPTNPGSVSFRAVASSLGLGFPLSMRQLLQHRDRARIRRFGICLVTLANSARVSSMQTDWFDRLFFDYDGVARFFRKASGGRQYVEWQAFWPGDLMTLAEKQALDNLPGDPRQPTVDAFRSAAKLKHVPVDSFDRWLWVIDQPGSGGGTTPSDSLVSTNDLSAQLAAHEMSHAFAIPYDFYEDPFCLMGRGSLARSFQNPRLALPGEKYTHGTTGPNLCANCLHTLRWLDAGNIIRAQRDGTVLDPAGAAVPGAVVTLNANQGAPVPGSTRHIALTVGADPAASSDPPQLWLEYRQPKDYDREIDRPVATKVVDLPKDGALVLHQVQYNGSPTAFLPFNVSWVAATNGATLPLPTTGRTVHILSVDSHAGKISLRIQ